MQYFENWWILLELVQLGIAVTALVVAVIAVQRKDFFNTRGGNDCSVDSDCDNGESCSTAGRCTFVIGAPIGEG